MLMRWFNMMEKKFTVFWKSVHDGKEYNFLDYKRFDSVSEVETYVGIELTQFETANVVGYDIVEVRE
jgi:hypothetical protein